MTITSDIDEKRIAGPFPTIKAGLLIASQEAPWTQSMFPFVDQITGMEIVAVTTYSDGGAVMWRLTALVGQPFADGTRQSVHLHRSESRAELEAIMVKLAAQRHVWMMPPVQLTPGDF